ncbi:MAG: hypothetical protein GY849_03050, partial [Deltaproteobacteria bacterium]|nr:hypothetical protein [Deltaproteobacteria bacterium]
MSIYSLPSLFSALLILVPLSIAIRNFNQSFQIRLLVFFLCQLFLYMFAEFCLVHSSGPTIALFWDKTIYFAISFMPATYLHIILRYRKAGPLSPLLLCLIYTPTILFISLLFTPLLVSGVQPEAWGYGKIEGPAFALFRAYLMLYLILNISILIYKYRNESDPRVRIGLCYFGLAYTVPMLATLIIVIILQPLGITSYNIGALAISIAALAAITSYAIIKHQLFDIPLIWGKFMNTERYRFIERFRSFVSRLYHTPRPLPDLVDEMSELFGCDVAFNIHGQPAWASGGSDAFRAFQPDFNPVGKDRQERQYRTAMEEIDHKMIYLLGETQKGLDEIDRAMNENGVEGLVHLNSGGKTLGVIKFGKGFSKNIYSGADHALLRKLTLLILMAVNYQRLMEEKLALKDARIAQLNADIERLRDSSRFPSPPDQISPAKIPPSVALDRVTLSKTGEDAFISASPRIQEIVEQLNTAARGARSILITGETGTGKEVLARHIAELSGRSPLVVVNCSAIPEHLFESEFFGHVKGAFTSAHAYRQGKLVQ